MSNNPRSLLRKHGLHPKKAWGQNFLVDPHMVERIVEQLRITPDDDVLELGAGTGALTALLAEQARHVYAVERDRDLVALLEAELDAENLEVIAADAARFSLQDVQPQRRLLVIGNLPYNITAPILFHLHEQRALFQRAILMVQKEVGDRLVATPDAGKDYSILSILFGAYFHVDQPLFVSRKHFFPRPKVDSVIVRLEPRDEPLAPIDDHALFQRTVKVAFAQRRKTLANNLRSGFHELDRETIQDLLTAMAIDPLQRGETLTIEQFADLSNRLKQLLAESNAET